MEPVGAGGDWRAWTSPVWSLLEETATGAPGACWSWKLLLESLEPASAGNCFWRACWSWRRPGEPARAGGDWRDWSLLELKETGEPRACWSRRRLESLLELKETWRACS